MSPRIILAFRPQLRRTIGSTDIVHALEEVSNMERSLRCDFGHEDKASDADPGLTLPVLAACVVGRALPSLAIAHLTFTPTAGAPSRELILAPPIRRMPCSAATDAANPFRAVPLAITVRGIPATGDPS
jgi:hypothetical protein